MTPAINDWNQIKTIFLRLFYMVLPSLSVMDKPCGRRSMLWDALHVNSSLCNVETIQSTREAWGPLLLETTVSNSNHQWLPQGNTFSAVLILHHLSLDGGGHPFLFLGCHEGLSWRFPPFVITCLFLTEFSSWCSLMASVPMVTLPSTPKKVLFIFHSVVFSLSISPSSKASSTTQTWFLKLYLQPGSLFWIETHVFSLNILTWTSPLNVSSAQQIHCAKIESIITLCKPTISILANSVIIYTVPKPRKLDVILTPPSCSHTCLGRHHVLLTNSTS